MTNEQRKDVADASWGQEPMAMCPHCGRTWFYAAIHHAEIPGMIPNHAYPATPVGGRLCPGSGQGPRNPESDRRPLWKDLPDGRKPTEHERKSTADVSPGLAAVWPSESQEKGMLADAGILEKCGPETSPLADAALHIKALLARVRELEAEVKRLTPYHEAVASLARQICCPKTTPEQMMQQILGGEEYGAR